MSFASNLQALIGAIPPDLMEKLNVTGASAVSPRTIKITLKTPAPDGTNQIKVTVEGGVFMVRGYKVEETEIFYGLDASSVENAVKAVAGVGA